MDRSSPFSLLLLRLIGAFLILLAATVILGWVLKISGLVRIVPGYAPMVFNTALSFILVGLALTLAEFPPKRRGRAQIVLGGLAAMIAALVLSQDLFSMDIGIDRLFSADWLEDERQYHTRMAPNTSLAFILSGATLILLNRGRGRWLAYAVQYLALCITLIGLTALLGYIFKLEFLFSWYPYARMAVHTAFGFTLLGIGLWVYWRFRSKMDQTDSPDARIIFTGGVILVIMALTAGIGGFLIIVQQTQAVLKRGLQVALHNRVEVYRDTFNTAIITVSDMATHPAIQRELQRLHVTPNHPDALEFLRRAMANYIGLGISAVALDDTSGRTLTQAGAFAHAPALRVPLNLPHSAELLWVNGLVMYTRAPIIVDKQFLGMLTVEQPLPILTKMFSNVAGLGKTGEMVLCVSRHGAIDCFPTRLRPQVFTVPRRLQGKLLAISHALDGVNDVSLTIDYRGNQVIAAYSPIYQTGLGLVIKMNVEELYQPIHHQFQQMLLLLLALTVGGILLLRWQVLPLARRLVVAERETRERETRFRNLIEAAPDAVVIAASDGRITLVNSQAETLFGYGRDELVGHPVEILQPQRLHARHVKHRHLYAQEPHRRAMGSGLALHGRRKDGSEFPMEASLSPLQTDDGLIVISAIRDISKRQEMEHALAESERRYRQLVDQSRGLICMHTLTGILTYVNAAAAESLGYTSQEMVGRNLAELLAPKSKLLLPAYLDHIGRERRASGLMVLLTKEGHKRAWAYDNVYYEDIIQGAYVLGHAQDVTAMRDAQDALIKANETIREHEIFLRSIIDHLPVALFCKDVRDGFRFTLWNNHSEAMFGLARDQILGKTDYDLFSKEQADFFRQKDHAIVTGNRVVDIPEEPIDSMSLGQIYLHTLKVPVPDAEGKPHYLLGISENITSRKHVEDALRTSEERLSAIMEHATDGIVTINDQGLIESYNTAAARIFGYGREQTIGRSIQMLMPPSLRSAHTAGLQRYLETGVPRVVGKGLVELQGLRQDGSEFPLELGINEVRLGEKRLFIGILRDITARKQAEQTLRELSLVDELTGLRNRRGFMALAEAEFLLARRMKCGLGLFYADLDGMKAINDAYGHPEGDNALRDIADILRKTFRDSDIIARLGGDEFAVLALETTQQKSEQMVQRLETLVAEHNRMAKRHYTLALSIGALYVDAVSVASLEALIAQTDAEMYRIKQMRRERAAKNSITKK